MRAIAYAILFVGFVLIGHDRTEPGWHLLALASITGAVICIIGGW